VSDLRPYWSSEQHGLRIYHGDCLEVLTALAEAGERFDLCLTDPPYNVGLPYENTRDNLKEAQYREWCAKWFRAVRGASSVVALSCGIANLSAWSGELKPDWWLAWHKPAGMSRCYVGFNNWEPVAVWGKPPAPICDYFRARIISDSVAGQHPCPKPIAWATQLISRLSNENVLDPFLGSGTALVAAYRLGREATGIEISEEYCELAARRLEAELAQGRLFEPHEVTGATQEAFSYD
jgi:site-specific DNA-methyltransferase (adenine-specific)